MSYTVCINDHYWWERKKGRNEVVEESRKMGKMGNRRAPPVLVKPDFLSSPFPLPFFVIKLQAYV